MDIIQIIDALETEFANSKNFLWSKKTLVNMDKCALLIAELKANLPQAIQEASYVLSKKEQILNIISSFYFFCKLISEYNLNMKFNYGTIVALKPLNFAIFR